MTADLAIHNGWYWPAIDTDTRAVVERDCEPSIRALLQTFAGRDCIVQAGANVGMYPVALAQHFNAVFTVEPDPTNWECLKRNLETRNPSDRIAALHAAFGEEEGACVPVHFKPRNCGAHQVKFGTGEIPVWTIDGLELSACDCIWLDIEGAELLALKGAVRTIEQFGPVIACEDKGLGRSFGVERGALQSWLAGFGYEQIGRIGNDSVFRRAR